MRKAKLMLIAIAALGCSALTHVENPVEPGYPCGTRGVVCSEAPLSCCWRGDVCGAKGTSCPEGACCYVGDEFGVTQEKRKQWRPE